MGCLNRLMAVCNALILLYLFASTVSAKVDIDYSHNVAGNGTVITDYSVGERDTSVAIGAIRGTGNVVSSYSLSTNNSSDLRIEDRFVLTKTADKASTMSVSPILPPWPGNPGSFKLTGKSWAENIELGSINSSRTYNSPSSSPLQSSGSKEGKAMMKAAENSSFEGDSQEGSTPWMPRIQA